VRDQPQPDVLGRLFEGDRTPVETGPAERGRGVVVEVVDVGADQRPEQPSGGGDQGHVDVVVREERAGVRDGRGGPHRRRRGHHHVLHGEPRQRRLGRGHVVADRGHLSSVTRRTPRRSALCTPQ
jgi:hypothetical protein